MNILLNHCAERKGSEHIILPMVGCQDEMVGKGLPEAWTRSVPGEEATTPGEVYRLSQGLVAAGLSVIPIEAYEGTKAPDTRRLPHFHDPVTGCNRTSWSIFNIRRPNQHELKRWYDFTGPYGLAVIGGTVSGGRHGCGLEVIDFDTASLAEPWREAVERQVPGLINRLVRVKTPRPGLHVYYRCERYGVCQKLALSDVSEDGHPIRKTLIELKGEGGYCLIPGCPPRCHPSSRMYTYVNGSPSLAEVPIISDAERAILLGEARALNQCKLPTAPQNQRHNRPKRTDPSLPGDDFNARANWPDILSVHGWTIVSRYGEEIRWCRPDKSGGISATTNHNGSDLLHVFSSNADPFELDGSYSKFAAYTLLNHNGDFSAAACELRKQGYGQRTLTLENKPGSGQSSSRAQETFFGRQS